MSVHRNSVSVLVLGAPPVRTPYYAFWTYLGPVAQYICNQPVEVDVHLYISSGQAGNLRIKPKRVEEWLRTAWSVPHTVTVQIIDNVPYLPDALLRFGEARCHDERNEHPPIIFCPTEDEIIVRLLASAYFERHLIRGIARRDVASAHQRGRIGWMITLVTEALALYVPPFDEWRRRSRRAQ